MWDVITHPCSSFSYDALTKPCWNYCIDDWLHHTVYMDVITYPCHNPELVYPIGDLWLPNSVLYLVHWDQWIWYSSKCSHFHFRSQAFPIPFLTRHQWMQANQSGRESELGLSGAWPGSWSCEGKPIMSWTSKFELNPINSLSANAQQVLDQSEARKCWEFIGA